MNTNDALEIGVLGKLIDSPQLQDKYLRDMLTYIFSNPDRRYIAYIMKRLQKNNIPITRENILIVEKHKSNIARKKKFGVEGNFTIERIYKHTKSSSVSDSVFLEAFQILHDEAFIRFAVDMVDEIKYSIEYGQKNKILTYAKSIINYHKVLFHNKTKKRYNPIDKTISMMKTYQAYLPTASYILNSAMGGWSRGFPNSMIGKPSHGKSTFMTWDSIVGITTKRLSNVVVISPEEPEETFWRRVFSIFLKIPMNLLRDGTYVMTEQQIKSLKKTFTNKLNFYEVAKLSDVVDLMFSVKTDFLWIDHINVIDYPRGDMYNGIIELVNREKEYLAKNKNTALVNLSQANTKEMLRKGRLVPQKEDAYNSSVLEQAAREFLAIYYPYVDATNPETGKLFRKGGLGSEFLPINRDLVKIYINKNSNGTLGNFNYRYHYNIGTYEDMKEEETKIDIILPKQEELNL